MENSQYIIPMGQSGNVLDKNYASMLPEFLKGEYLYLFSVSEMNFDNQKICTDENGRLSCKSYAQAIP